MNQEIRTAIINLFANHASRSQDWLVSEIRNLGIIGQDGVEVVRTIGLMQDAGELESIALGVYRLTLKAVKANAPLHKKALEYFIENWIAIVALTLSIVSLLKG